MTESYVTKTESGTVFVGADATALYAAIALKHAIALYAKTGMRPNRAYTPSRMLEAASRITGKTYKRGQMAAAAADLNTWCETAKQQIEVR